MAVADSFLTLTFTHGVDNPEVKGIEIVRQRSFRVNAGGPLITATDGGPNWSPDSQFTPSPYVNATAIGNFLSSTGATIDLSDPSVPAGTPMSLFQTERWDDAAAPEMTWSLPAGPGMFQVRLYFAETFGRITGPGQRVFDVSIEGRVVLHAFDVYARVGSNKAIVQTFNLPVGDGQLDITFLHGVQNPAIKAIEVSASTATDVTALRAPSTVGVLGQNVPNPFNPRTTISFALAHAGRATVRVYDVAGRLVTALVDADLAAGQHEVNWTGSDDAGRPVASGVDLYRIQSGGLVQTKRMALVR